MNFTKHHEVCLGLLQTQVILPVPFHVTPTFSTSAGNCPFKRHAPFLIEVIQRNHSMIHSFLNFILSSIFIVAQLTFDGDYTLNLWQHRIAWVLKVIRQAKWIAGKHRLMWKSKRWFGICRSQSIRRLRCNHYSNRLSSQQPSNE